MSRGWRYLSKFISVRTKSKIQISWIFAPLCHSEPVWERYILVFKVDASLPWCLFQPHVVGTYGHCHEEQKAPTARLSQPPACLSWGVKRDRSPVSCLGQPRLPGCDRQSAQGSGPSVDTCICPISARPRRTWSHCCPEHRHQHLPASLLCSFWPLFPRSVPLWVYVLLFKTCRSFSSYSSILEFPFSSEHILIFYSGCFVPNGA